MKILNLYAGIGGNRKLWGDKHKITAVEWDKKIAKIYSDFFPKDRMVIDDAHKYLLKHFEEYDFIWSSPPCPTHSRINTFAMGVQNPYKYPDMKLYEEVLLLQHHYKGKYCIENVISYYKPLVEPQELAQHYFWANFYITPFTIETRNHYGTIKELENLKGFNIDEYKLTREMKRKILRNCVEPETGKHILDCAIKEQERLI